MKSAAVRRHTNPSTDELRGTITVQPAGPRRRWAAGAEMRPDGVHFRVWAPERQKVTVILDEDRRSLPLSRESDGYFSGHDADLRAGARYWLRLDDDEKLYPDPASRFQPEGPHGPSEVVDPHAFPWTDKAWRGISLAGQIIYELHVGTFSEEGTWAGARAKLPQLAELGVTVLEVMPVAEFPGRFGWGYDGVDLYAPAHIYGTPDEFRRFVDEAHRLGLAVILDVVYNHLGPDGNYLASFSPHYFSKTETEWGKGVNYDGPHCGPVRDFMAENAAYWIADFHLDGLRLDATQCLFDTSAEHIIGEIERRARAAAGERSIVLLAENEPQHTQLVRPSQVGGFGLDGLLNDDFHHTAVVAATGRSEGYYSEYGGTAQELLSSVKYGYLYQGQRYHWQQKRRGQPTRGLPAWAMVAFLENHDQTANSCRGERMWQLTSPGRHRALTTLLLLGPWTPYLLQGEEWSSTRPFVYFADHGSPLRELVRKGRGEFLAQFPSCASSIAQEALPDPGDPQVFERVRLDWSERERPAHAAALALHRALIELRKSDPTLRAQGRNVTIDGAVLSPDCFVVRHLAEDPREDRLLLVNLGRQLRLRPIPEPLLAPPEGCRWQVAFSSDERRFGGPGEVAPENQEGFWDIPGESAYLLTTSPVTEANP